MEWIIEWNGSSKLTRSALEVGAAKGGPPPGTAVAQHQHRGSVCRTKDAELIFWGDLVLARTRGGSGTACI